MPTFPASPPALLPIVPAHAAGDVSARKGRPWSWLTPDRVFVASVCSASMAFFAVAYSISLRDPGYFDRRLIAAMQQANLDPITTGAVAAVSTEADGGKPMPAPSIARARPPVAGDYQIVMVFEREAILATADELVRVKVGSVLPGLGEVLSIDATTTGGVVRASEATLRNVTE